MSKAVAIFKSPPTAGEDYVLESGDWVDPSFSISCAHDEYSTDRHRYPMEALVRFHEHWLREHDGTAAHEEAPTAEEAAALNAGLRVLPRAVWT